MKHFDNNFLDDKTELIAGVDESGRGPLAGPVVAASVIFSPDVYIEGVNDSKLLSEKTREILYDIISREALVWSVAAVSHGTIDRINILNATFRAMLKSVNRLEIKPDLILIDGNRSFNCDIPARTIVKGDQKSFCIAAASILAKVTRDRLMKRLAAYFPAYRWEKNKGYATQEHINAVKVAGPSPLHRKTFLRNILDHKTETEFDLETAL